MEVLQYNVNSMTALHLPWMDAPKWVAAMEAHNFKSVKAPIVIGCVRPTGFAPSFPHKPLSACQTFFLFKTVTANKPYNNCYLIHHANPKAPYRAYWSDHVSLSSAEYQRAKSEVRFVVCSCSRITFVVLLCHVLARP